MRVSKINDMKGGWYIGNFTPTVYQTSDFEVSHKLHEKNSLWDKHYHKIATEINYLLRGKMIICGETLVSGDIFIIEKEEVVDPIFLEDCDIICVKVPSAENDKYIIDK